MNPLAKTQVSLNQVSAAQKREESEAREYCIQQEVGSDTSDNDNIPLHNWPPTVGVTEIAMYH